MSTIKNHSHGKNYSHSKDPMTESSLGKSRKWGDADDAVKFEVQKEIVKQATKANLSQRDIANLLALAEVESGFNPDASTTSRKSSASGVFAITDSTAKDAAHRLSGSDRIGEYKVDGSYHRFDTASNVSYGIAVYLDKKKIAGSSDVGEIYKAWNTNPSEYNPLLGRLEKHAALYHKGIEQKVWEHGDLALAKSIGVIEPARHVAHHSHHHAAQHPAHATPHIQADHAEHPAPARHEQVHAQPGHATGQTHTDHTVHHAPAKHTDHAHHAGHHAHAHHHAPAKHTSHAHTEHAAHHTQHEHISHHEHTANATVKTGERNFSHSQDPLTASSLGNSRKWGDASKAVQFEVQKEIIGQATKANLSQHDIANLLALAKVESGFNPDASTPSHKSSASGVFAITDTTAKDAANRLSGSDRIGGYKVDGSYDRFNTASNVSYGIAVYLDKKQIADSPDVGEIYKAWNTNPQEYNPLLGRLQKDAAQYQKDLDNKHWDGPGPAASAKTDNPAGGGASVSATRAEAGQEVSKSDMSMKLGVLSGSDSPSSRLLTAIHEPVAKVTNKPV